MQKAKKHIAGDYYVKTRGRGVCRATLTASQAKALFEVMANGFLEIENIQLTDEKRLKAIIRLEEIRKEIKKESISYGEIAELQALSQYIDKGDIELLQWAGVKEQ